MENKIEWVEEDYVGFEEGGFYIAVICRDFKEHNAKFDLLPYSDGRFICNGSDRGLNIIAILNVNLADGKNSFQQILSKFRDLPATKIEKEKYEQRYLEKLQKRNGNE